ncbi:venom protease-like [Venturia canescens]|uniref:venom protease-like n=1 Tax=Venturia canescens TaxID=32260 RepID=UPI001C9BD99A|nr:venom protease-like [Venturia canescens]
MPVLIRSVLTYAILVLLYPFGIETQQYDQGDACETNKGLSGRCELLQECPSVYRDTLAGILPDKLCGFLGFDPIVCCPSASSQTAATSATTASVRSDDRRTPSWVIEEDTERNFETAIVGRLGRQKCREYAKSVFAVVKPPTLSISQSSVNISLCAIKFKALVVGGTKADPKEFPHMAAVGFDSESSSNGQPVWLCGGTLVSDRFVLTAAHCTFSLQYGNAAWVRVGDLNLATDDDDARPQTLRVTERIRHPDYKRPAEYHDLALLRLESRVVFDAFTRPACLPSPELDVGAANEEGQRVIAAGWGRVNWADEDGSNNLLKVTLERVSQETCNASYFSDGTIDYKLRRGIVGEWQICAGAEGRDTCQGDSGGPIVVFDPEHECMYDVVGITSLGRLCGSNVPGIYTRVHNYLSWLENTIWR